MMRAHPGPISHHVRKVIKVGRSIAVVIPPHVLDHLGVEHGDFLVYDLNVKHHAVLSRAPVPPYIDQPELLDQAETEPP